MPSEDKKATVKMIKKLPIKEKIKLLSPEDKLYLSGYIDHALQCGKPQKKVTWRCQHETDS